MLKRIPNAAIVPVLAGVAFVGLTAAGRLPTGHEALAADPPPKAAAPAPTPTPGDEAAKVKEAGELLERLRARAEEDDLAGAPVLVTNPQTGKQEQRIPKSNQYYVVRGRLYNAVLHPRLAGGGLPLVREDDKYFYVEPPSEPGDEPPLEKNPDPGDESLRYLTEVPEEEAEVVAPPFAASGRLRLEDASGGLPTAGMWRENFAVADLDGDGRPEIVAPPPRLSGQPLQVFRRTGSTWTLADVTWDDPDKIGFEYGGVAVGDMNGDGRPDIVYGRHGGGPAVAFNKGEKGGLSFRIETRGLPVSMSTRSVVLGDVDKDGRLDILSISDAPEYTEVRRAESEGNAMARQPRPDGYVPGYDVRAFLNRGAKFEEHRDGLDGACFGYTMSVVASPGDGGAPFLVTSCRYRFVDRILWEFDRASSSFRSAGSGAIEAWAYPIGTATGTYMGHPAAVTSYFKTGPQGATRDISGNGVSLYYRVAGAWKRHRLVKSVAPPSPSAGIAMGDLDGDGLDDVVWADDSIHKVRVFFQAKDGSFRELAESARPSYPNHATAVRLADVDGDKRLDVVVMCQYLTGDENRAGGLRVFRNLR